MELKLTSDRLVVGVAQVPRFNVTLKNLSGSPVRLVKCLDGSQERLRYPVVRVEVADGDTWSAPPLGRCGNTNNLSIEDFFDLKPGAAWNPTTGWFVWDRIASAFEKPGVVRVRFVYDTKSDEWNRWRGLMGPQSDAEVKELQRALSKVPKETWVSNVVTIRVEKQP